MTTEVFSQAPRLHGIAAAGRAKLRDDGAGSTELRLALTYAVARQKDLMQEPVRPWLAWNRFYDGVQEDPQELLIRSLLDADASPRLWSLVAGRSRDQLRCPVDGCHGSTYVGGDVAFGTVSV